ncbi:MAG: hypothetical protein H7Y88_09175 [Phycisphaerales bacterium]|nr:hypothetical protein [Phycisphaerales bacterium]
MSYRSSSLARRLTPAAILRALVWTSALIAVGAAQMAAAPEPDPVPRRWQLEIIEGPLRVTSIEFEDGPQAFLYMTYTVTNNSGEDLLFAPSFEIATGENEVIRSGRGVPLAATKTIIESVQNPLVEDQISIIGQILQGKENAKDGIVIWPLTDMNTSELTVYGAGLSGETATVTPPGSGEKFVLRKTLMIRYRVSGTLESRGSTPLDVAERRWIMR